MPDHTHTTPGTGCCAPMTTEAGKRLLSAVGGPPAPAVVEEMVRQEIAAVEAEAAARERERIRAAVEGLVQPPYDGLDWNIDNEFGWDTHEDAVLAIVNPEAAP